jgi:hypothetical protein
MAAPLIVNEERHDSAWTLVHALASSNFISVTSNSQGKATNVVNWTDGTMTNKLREVIITYNADGTVATVVRKQYDQNTFALLQTMTGVFAYSGSLLASITWTRS